MAKWIEDNYKVGQEVRAFHPATNNEEMAEVTILTIDRIEHPFSKSPTGIMVKFEDGTFMEISQGYLYEDGSGM